MPPRPPALTRTNAGPWGPFQDDIILVKSKMEDAGWWDGQSETTGVRGIFPNNFVEQMSEQRRPSVECT